MNKEAKEKLDHLINEFTEICNTDPTNFDKIDDIKHEILDILSDFIVAK
mgnify:CR=1 FL=1